MAALTQTEEAFPSLLQVQDHAVLLLAGTVRACNAAAPTLLHVSRSALIGSDPIDLLPPAQADGSPSRESFHRRTVAARGGLAQAFELRLRRADGTLVDTLAHLELAGLEAADTDGPAPLALKLTDISRLGQSARKPHETEERPCGTASDTAPRRTEEALRHAALAVSSSQGEALFQELSRYLAATLAVEGAFIAECSTPDNSHVRTRAVYTDTGYEPNIEYALRGTVCGTVVGQAFRFVPSKVREHYPEDPMFRRLSIEGYAAYPLSDSHGLALGLIAVMSRRPLADRELTESMLKIFAGRAAAEIERRRSEEARRISEESYRSIFEASEDAIFIRDWDSGAILDVNPKACEAYGYTREQLQQLRIGQLSAGTAPYTEQHARAYLERAKDGQAQRFEWHRRNRDGSLHWDEVWLKSAMIAGKRRLVAFTREITERKRAEDALRSAALAVSTAQADSVFEQLVRYLAATLSVDVAFIAEFNPDDPSRMRTLARMIDGELYENVEYPLDGTPCETVVGREFRFYPQGVTERFTRGSLRAVGLESYAAFPLFDVQGRALGLIAVVDRRPMRDPALLESVLKIFAARAASEIARKLSEDALRASEEQHRAIFNASVDGMVLIDSTGTIVEANPAFLDLFGYAREELEGGTSDRLLTSECDDAFRALVAGLGAGQVSQRECRAARRDGACMDIEVRGVPMHYRGQLHLLVIVRDISARRQAEAQRAKLEAQLRQAQKMEAIGHLAGGIAHDFNNILTSVMGYVVLAAERQEDLGDARLARYLDQAQQACTRARDLIQKMLTFSRGRGGEARPLSLAPLVKEAVKLLRSTLPATVELQTQIEAELPPVRLDPVQVEQVLLNLCINARDAMKGSGRITVRVRMAGAVEHICASCRMPVKGTRMEFSVEDSGPGIAPELLDRIFEPFFSTKEVGKGSGMGLSSVHGIVHEHGGHIVVDSAPGAGAAFRVLLEPLIDVLPDAPIPRRRTATTRRRSPLQGRVLVVDDEPMVAESMAELLQSWGLSVTVQISPVEARMLLRTGPQRFDLVIADQTMPKLTGLELASEVVSLRPELPVILYSGYSDTLSADDVRRAGVSVLVRKPVEPAVLYATLLEHLPKATSASRATERS